MVVIGVDAHKRSHTLVAVDQAGRKLAEKTVPATSDGHLAAISWAARWPQAHLRPRGLPPPDAAPRDRPAHLR